MAAAAGDVAVAVANGREALAAREAFFEAGNPRIAEARAELGRALLLAGERDEGRRLLGEALPLLETWGLLHPDDRAALHAALRG
jgi:hypothetical protein